MALCRSVAGGGAFRLRRIGRRGRAIRACRAPGRSPSLCGAHCRGVAAVRHPRALDSRRAARRKRGRCAGGFVGRRDGIDAGDARHMGGPARPPWPRPRSLRPARQHPRRHGLSARNVRPLRQCRRDAGSLQCRSRSLRRAPRDRPRAASRDAGLCRRARANPRRRGCNRTAVIGTATAARLARGTDVCHALDRRPNCVRTAVRGAIGDLFAAVSEPDRR